MKNPFEILGIARELAKQLPDEKLSALIRSNYRFLSLVYHPDRGGDAEKFKELSEAFNLLNLNSNRESFEYHKKLFLREMPLRTKIEDLEKKIEEQDFEHNKSIDNLVSYISGIAKKERTIFDNGIEIVLQDQNQYSKSLGALKQRTPKYEIQRSLEIKLKRINDITDSEENLHSKIRNQRKLIEKYNEGFKESKEDYEKVADRNWELKRRVNKLYKEREEFEVINKKTLSEKEKAVAKYSIILNKKISMTEKALSGLKNRESDELKKEREKLEQRLKEFYRERDIIDESGKIGDSKLEYINSQVKDYMLSLNKKIENNENLYTPVKQKFAILREGKDSHEQDIENAREDIRNCKGELRKLRIERISINKEIKNAQKEVALRKAGDFARVKAEIYDKSFKRIRIDNLGLYEKHGRNYLPTGERAIGVVPLDALGGIQKAYVNPLGKMLPINSWEKTKLIYSQQITPEMLKTKLIGSISPYLLEGRYLIVAASKGTTPELYVRGVIKRVTYSKE